MALFSKYMIRIIVDKLSFFLIEMHKMFGKKAILKKIKSMLLGKKLKLLGLIATEHVT